MFGEISLEQAKVGGEIVTTLVGQGIFLPFYFFFPLNIILQEFKLHQKRERLITQLKSLSGE